MLTVCASPLISDAVVDMVNMCLCLHTVKLAGSLVKAKHQLLPVVVRGTLRVCTANTV